MTDANGVPAAIEIRAAADAHEESGLVAWVGTAEVRLEGRGGPEYHMFDFGQLAFATRARALTFAREGALLRIQHERGAAAFASLCSDALRSGGSPGGFAPTSTLPRRPLSSVGA